MKKFNGLVGQGIMRGLYFNMHIADIARADTILRHVSRYTWDGNPPRCRSEFIRQAIKEKLERVEASKQVNHKK